MLLVGHCTVYILDLSLYIFNYFIIIVSFHNYFSILILLLYWISYRNLFYMHAVLFCCNFCDFIFNLPSTQWEALQKNKSLLLLLLNRFVCADFCSDIGRCALTSVREKIGVTSSNNGTSPTIVTHKSSDESLRFFLGAACDKKSVVCADSVREKFGHSLGLFLGAPYDKKSVHVRWALLIFRNWCYQKMYKCIIDGLNTE